MTLELVSVLLMFTGNISFVFFIIAGELSLSPTSVDQVKLHVLVSDGKANTSISFKVKVCSCENDGICNWNSTSSNAAFSVSKTK